MKPSTLLTCMNALSRFAFMATVIVLPFFFIPFSSVNAGALKGALLFIGITISVLAYAIARFIDGELSFPKTRINLALMFVLIVTLVSAIFSPAFYKSMFGLSFEMGTFASILVLVLVYFLGVHHVVKDRSRKIIVRGLFVSFFASFAIIVASFFLSSNQVFVNVFKGISGGTLVGSWSEYGIFSAVIVLLSLFYSALVKNSLIKKIFYWISIAMGLLVLALVNIILLWVTVGVFSLIFFVYTVSLSHKPGVVEYSEKQTKLPVTAFLVVVVCILFTVGNSVVGTVVSSKLGYVSDFAQPSIASNALVYKMQSAGNPLRSILGVGPARFTEAWMHFKPVEVNNTAYWDTAFYSGFGTIMTMLVTTGALGFISWIFFLLIYFVTGISVLTSQLKTENFDSGLVITFIVSAFLWVVNLLIVSNVTIFVMTFTMTTLFVGALISRNIVEVPRNTYLKDPRNSFFAILLLVCIMIGSIVSLYFSSVKLVSIVYFTKATNATSVESAQTYVQHAIQLQNKNDNYYRTLSSLYLNQLGTLLSKDKNTPNLQTNVQGLLNAAQQSSTQAVSIDSNNYSNWLSLGQFFQSATMLQAEGDPYKNGVTSYEKAAYFVPNSPAIPLAQARLELANKNIPAAQDFITKSLSLKKGYVAGYQLRAQIAFDAKDYKESINQLSQAIVLNPQVSDLYVSRGMLYNQTGAYVDAANDFRMAFNLNSNPNTAYLLAQADIKINAFEEATTIIDALVKANPDNADIKDLKDKLQQAKNPTPVVQPTTDTKKVETKK